MAVFKTLKNSFRNLFKHPKTLLLKLALVLLASPLLPIFLSFVPWFLRQTYGDQGQGLLWAFLFAACLMAVPYLRILLKAYWLLRYIDEGVAFSQKSVVALKAIAQSGLLIFGVYLALSPLSFRIADVQDAPGIFLLHMVLCLMPLVVAVFAAVLEKLLAQAIAYKEDSELTI